MSLYDLLKRRRMVREYEPQAVEAEKLTRLLEAALSSPSAGHSQGISLVVLQEAETRRRVAQLAGEADWVARGYPAWLSTAPVHLVLCAEPEVYRQRYREPDKARAAQQWPVPYWHLDAGCLLMTLLLASLEEGLAAGFQGIHNLPGLPEELDIPYEVEVIGLVTLGYSKSQRRGHSTGRGRRSGRIHHERW